MELITVKPPAISDLVGAVVGANGNIPLAHERLRRKGFIIEADEIVAQLASDPTASEQLAKQFRMKATLVTYQMLMSYQAELMSALGDDERPLSQQGAVQGFSAISSLFNSLTDQRGAPTFTGNIIDRIMAVIPDPQAREALATLAAAEPLPPAPIPKRKQGRPPGSLNHARADLLEELDSVT